MYSCFFHRGPLSGSPLKVPQKGLGSPSRRSQDTSSEHTHRDGKYISSFKDTAALPMSLDPQHTLLSEPIQMHNLVVLRWMWYPVFFFFLMFVSQLFSASAQNFPSLIIIYSLFAFHSSFMLHLLTFDCSFHLAGLCH